MRLSAMAAGIKTGGGSRKGVPNQATADARKAIGAFVDGNAGRLQEWLDAIASGTLADGTPLESGPNPEKAFSLFQSVIEYHVPKLARNEVSATVATQQLSKEEIDSRLAALGVVIK